MLSLWDLRVISLLARNEDALKQLITPINKAVNDMNGQSPKKLRGNRGIAATPGASVAVGSAGASSSAVPALALLDRSEAALRTFMATCALDQVNATRATMEYAGLVSSSAFALKSLLTRRVD